MLAIPTPKPTVLIVESDLPLFDDVLAQGRGRHARTRTGRAARAIRGGRWRQVAGSARTSRSVPSAKSTVISRCFCPGARTTMTWWESESIRRFMMVASSCACESVSAFEGIGGRGTLR